MRSRFLACILILALPALTYAEAKKASGADELGQHILNLENEWMSAAVRRDGNTLDRLMADDFLLVSERWDGNRELTPKQSWIENTLTTIEAKSFGYDKVKTQIREGLVIVHCLFTYDAINKGKPWGGTVRVTDVWVKEGDRWRILARHASRPLQQRPQ